MKKLFKKRIFIIACLLVLIIIIGLFISLNSKKTAIFFGDSVAYGQTTNGQGFGYYINKIENFSDYTNAAVGQATINTITQSNNNIINQIEKYKNNKYNYVILQGGFGDLRDVPELGTISNSYDPNDFDTSTFSGAVEYTLYLATKYWNKSKIGFIISYDTPNSNLGIRSNYEETKKYWDTVKVACIKWNVPYLDLFEGSILYNNEMKSYSEIIEVTNNKYLSQDGIHPTEKGYELICPFIDKWMRSLPKYTHKRT